MAQFAPHYNLFKIITTLRNISSFVFWIIFGIALLPDILIKINLQLDLKTILATANISLMIAFFVIDVLIDILVPMADTKRRDDFLDNSLGCMLSSQSSIGYYDNDEVSIGFYKVAVNLYQNCFTTFSLVKQITIKRTLLPIFVLVIIIIMAYRGFQESTFAITTLQVLFSATVLGTVIKHVILLVKLSSIESYWIGLFSDPTFKTNTDSFKHKILKNWFAYETLHSKIPAEIPKTTYDKWNPILTAEWLQIKVRYNIN